MKLFSRILVWSIPLLLIAGAYFALDALVEDHELSRARTLLLAGDEAQARLLFSRHLDSAWNGDRARAGLAVCRALAGDSSAGDEGAAAGIDTSPFALSLLMDRELRAGEFERSLRLAELGEKSGEPTATLYRAAAFLELGNDEEAQTLWLEVSERLKSSFLGKRLGAALKLRRDGAVTVVRDRTGLTLGTLDESGEFSYAPGVEPQLVPPATLKKLGGARPGAGLRLSADLELGRIASNALEGYRGSVVLIDPHSGAVLAAVSDDRTLAGGGTPALQQRLEPASIAKIMTLTAALRAGFDADAEIAKLTCGGAVRYQGGILYCPYIAGKLRGLNHAMAISCNIAFAELGAKVGWEGMVDELRRYGFDGQIGNPFALGKILVASGSERELADLSIGLEATDITTLHAALIAAALANGGVMPEPALIAGSDGALGLSPSFRQPAGGRRVMEKEWLPEVLASLAGVTGWGGTARWVAPPGFPVAMKTGTGSSRGGGYHVNYIGVGPLPGPRIAFAVRVTGQRTSSRARKAGFEVTGRLLQGLEKVAAERGWR